MESEKKMRFFQMVQKMLAKLGFIPNHNQNYFNKHHAKNMAVAVLTVVSQVVYIRKEAATIDRYMHAYFMGTAIIAIAISYVGTIFKTSELYDFVRNLEKLTNRSK